MSRPEHISPADVYYNELESRRYAVNSRMMDIQTRMSERAIELLETPAPALILDIGCGSGLSGEALTEAGYYWTGVDISAAMLGVAKSRDVEGDLICGDIGQGLFFKPACFDGCISISVIQWLCNADKREHVPAVRLKAFFTTLYSCLKRGAKAIFQFYPETPQQMTLITEAAMKSGFSGGLTVDNPNSTKAKKYFLCLTAGEGFNHSQRPGKEDDEVGEGVEERRSIEYTKVGFHPGVGHGKGGDRQKGRVAVKSREWILAKKERMRKQGKKTAADSKFTGRKRGPKF